MTNIRYISSAVEIVQQRSNLSSWLEKQRKKNSSDDDKTSVKRKNENMQQVEHGPFYDKEEPVRVNSLLEMFIYIFYLPLLFTGPILTFDNFNSQVSFLNTFLILC